MRRLNRLLLALSAVAVLTWILGGSVGGSFGRFSEGEIAPATAYAPFRFSFEEEGRTVVVERGERMVNRGERLTLRQVNQLKVLEEWMGKTKKRFSWLAALLISLVFVGWMGLYLKKAEGNLWKHSPHLTLVALGVGLLLGMGRVMLGSLQAAWIPVASVAMLISILFSLRLGIFLGILSSVFLAFAGEVRLPVLVGWCAASLVGGVSMAGVRRRIEFFRAGLLTGAAQALVTWGSEILWGALWSEALSASMVSFGSGVISGVITLCLVPIAESVFGLITDVTLLELSDLNHPLLKGLSAKAPGTYHHSLLVANLAEAASDAVKANSLLARVGCYFHDIGKMSHPAYFVENQSPEESHHDRLEPSLSSLVILNHVKEGIRLARQHRLHPMIVDFIPGHHGTGMIYYFYRRALEETEDASLLKEDRFRYPGPKPQTKETAIALLADSVEAATRVLQDKAPTRIQGAVRRIINNKFIDGQLDECDLTLKDLDRIAEAFVKVLAGVYHSRVEYPRMPWEEPEVGSAVSG